MNNTPTDQTRKADLLAAVKWATQIDYEGRRRRVQHQRNTMLYLCAYANLQRGSLGYGAAEINLRDVAGFLDVRRRSVYRLLLQLETAGHIRRIDQQQTGWRVYRLECPEIMRHVPSAVAQELRSGVGRE